MHLGIDVAANLFMSMTASQKLITKSAVDIETAGKIQLMNLLRILVICTYVFVMGSSRVFSSSLQWQFQR